MTNNNQTLKSFISINRQFQKSIRIDRDKNNIDALNGYVAQKSNLNIIDQLAKTILDNKGSAFTWTGPYGSGKSSLALMLSALMSNNKQLSNKAKKILNLTNSDYIIKLLKSTKKPTLSLNIVGSDISLRDSIIKELQNENIEATRENLLNVIEEQSKDKRVLLIIDELGKFLEISIKDKDIMFLQELAEVASRSNGSFIVIGILHQSFNSYISDYDSSIRDEWAKVQGRYENYQLIPSIFETLNLIASSIEQNAYVIEDNKQDLCNNIAEILFKDTPQFLDSYKQSFLNALPLHPITAILICALSKKSYGQNERSVFSFLTSNEARSFHVFLEETSDLNRLYLAQDLYDYINLNHSSNISSSHDNRIWNMCFESISSLGNKVSNLAINILKVICVIEIYGKIHSIHSSFDVLKYALMESDDNLLKALQELIDKKAIIYRNYNSTYALFEGSDFDFDVEFEKVYNQTEIDIHNIRSILEEETIIAKRNYFKTGTQRWFNVQIALDTECSAILNKTEPQYGAIGTFFLVFITKHSLDDSNALGFFDKYELKDNIVYGINTNSKKIINLSRSIQACKNLLKLDITDGDIIAKKEIKNREAQYTEELNNQINLSLSESIWRYKDRFYKENSILSSIASDVADILYSKSIKINNELINREKPSAAMSKARKDLMYAMVNNEQYERLGIEKEPAELGLYLSTLKTTNFHQKIDDNTWKFILPDNDTSNIKELFIETLKQIQASDEFTFSQIKEIWSGRPYGMKGALIPIYFLLFIIIYKNNLACYNEKIFQTSISINTCDEIFASPERFSLKYVGDDLSNDILKAIKDSLVKIDIKIPIFTPLFIGKALVRFVLSKPSLTQKTKKLSSKAQKLKDEIVRANDPIDLLFNKIPSIFTELKDSTDDLVNALLEIQNFYQSQLDELKDILFATIKHKEEQGLDELAKRGEALKDISLSNKDQQFSNKISAINQDVNKSIEGIISLCSEKPALQWTDADIKGTKVSIPLLALNFRQAEANTQLYNRDELRRVYCVTFGASNKQDIVKVVDVSVKESEEINKEADKLLNNVFSNLDYSNAIALLAEIGARLKDNG